VLKLEAGNQIKEPVYCIQQGDPLDVVDRRLAEDYTEFCSRTSKAKGLVNKAFTKAHTKKGKGKR